MQTASALIETSSREVLTSYPSLELHFQSAGQLCLAFAAFKYSLLPGGKVVSVRGDTLGAYNFQSTYRWSKAVKVLSLFFLREKARAYDDHPFFNEAKIVFRGDVGSHATSLAATIDKQPMWLFEMFGCSISGRPFSKKIFRIKNPQRRAGPEVLISLNNQFLTSDRISIFLDEKPIVDTEKLLSLAAKIEADI